MGIFSSLKLEDNNFGFFAFEEADLSLAQRLHEYRLRRRMEQARLGLPYYQEREVSQIVRAFQQAGAVTTQHTNTPQGLRISLESGTEIRVTDHRLYFNAPPSSPEEWRAATAYIKRSRPNQTAYPGGSDETFKASAYAYATAHGLKVEGYTPPDHMLPLIQQIQQQERQHLTSGAEATNASRHQANPGPEDRRSSPVNPLLAEGAKPYEIAAALSDAAAEGDIKTVRAALARGASVNETDLRCETPLGRAARNGQLETMHVLLAAGADPEAAPSTLSHFRGLSLWNAAENGQAAAVQLLLEAGADVHSGNGRALWLAASKGHADTVKVLLQGGAHLQAQDDAALREAAKNGHTDTVKVLLDAGANVHAGADAAYRSFDQERERQGRVRSGEDSALIWAARNGHAETVKALLDAGANVHVENDRVLREAARDGQPEVVKVLLAGGADMNALDGAAMRAASWSASKGHVATVRVLRAAAGSLSGGPGG